MSFNGRLRFTSLPFSLVFHIQDPRVNIVMWESAFSQFTRGSSIFYKKTEFNPYIYLLFPIEHFQRMQHANRGYLLLRTTDPVLVLELASVLVETNPSWTCPVSGKFSFEHPSAPLFCLLKLSHFGYEISVLIHNVALPNTLRFNRGVFERAGSSYVKERFYRRMDVKILHVFIVAENTWSVHIGDMDSQK